jgi:hypothetical protein
LWLTVALKSVFNTIYNGIDYRLYENSFSKIKIGKQISSGFYVIKGLPKGCSLSPNLFIQNALENWQKKCARMGLEIQDMTIYSILFADDQLLIA